jgi:phosphoribosyl 1,2-cyclic phosphate phosphodiesterase
MKRRLPVWADGDTQNALYARFGYAFMQPDDSPYPPILDMHTIGGDVTIDGAGGPMTLTPFEVDHGAMDALGFRIGDVAYLPDVARIPDDVWPLLEGLDCWILDALRRKPHPTHAHLAQSLEWIERVAPKLGILTNMHIDMDYRTLTEELPPHVRPAHDGMVLTYTV